MNFITEGEIIGERKVVVAEVVESGPTTVPCGHTIDDIGNNQSPERKGLYSH